MFEILNAGCQASRRKLEELDLAVPHQANQRILDNVGRNCPIPMFSNILNLGNTASTSIPLALQDICRAGQRGQKLGLCTFGGGFTCGAALIDVV
jgi:3-oxoacyl-[acyl-carrier-protein] synthase-3